MYWGMFFEVSAFLVDIVGGAEQGNDEYKGSVATGRDPNRAHPGGYSQRDSTS